MAAAAAATPGLGPLQLQVNELLYNSHGLEHVSDVGTIDFFFFFSKGMQIKSYAKHKDISK